MSNVSDYLKWRGDLDFSQAPFNDVDNLILAQIAYVDFTDIVPAPGSIETITIAEAADTFFDTHDEKEIKKCKSFIGKAPYLLREAAATKRFGSLILTNYVDYVDYYVAGHLLRREHYGSVKLYTEYFTAVPTDAGLEARVFQRLFYNLDGSIALEEIKKTPGDLTKSVYRQGTHWFYSESELLSQAIGTLQFSAKDHIIVDRLERLPFTQTLLKMKGEATLSCVLHSIHHWGDCINSEYFLLFQYANYFDHIIVSTEAQKEELERDLSSDKPVSVLPVGGLERLQYSDNRKPYSLMIAARFERRKRLDLAIDAVVALHEKIPEVTLDIYGQGMLWQEIEEKIKQLNAQSYIHLKGHQDLQTRFKAYELYLATSEWETFGLTLLEAIGSGLVMVGTDVPYGNPTFIKNDRNGFLVPFVNQSHEEVVADLKRSMQKAFGNLNFLREGSYKLAERYMTDQIIGQWREFLTNRGKNNDVLSGK